MISAPDNYRRSGRTSSVGMEMSFHLSGIAISLRLARKNYIDYVLKSPKPKDQNLGRF